MKTAPAIIEPARIVDKDVYDLMVTLQECRKKYVDIAQRLKGMGIETESAYAQSYDDHVYDAIINVSSFAQDELVYLVEKGSKK